MSTNTDRLVITRTDGSQETRISFCKDKVIIDTTRQQLSHTSASCKINDLWNLLKAQIFKIKLDDYANDQDQYRRIERLKLEATSALKTGYAHYNKHTA